MDNSLQTKSPKVAREWHPTLNEGVSPSEVAAGSHKIFFWLGACGHEWDAQVGKRANGEGCPICRGLRIAAGVNDLATLRPDIAAQWHREKNKNIKLKNGEQATPKSVGPGSRMKIWWIGACGHEWEASIEARSRGTGCKYCKGSDVLKGINDLETLRPDIALRWDRVKNGSLKPSDVRVASSKKVYWLCDLGHSFSASVNGVTSGRGCSVCRNLDIRPGVNDLATLRPDLAAEWDFVKNASLSTKRKIKLTPQTVGQNTAAKVWWLCPNGHSYDTTIKSRSERGIGCRICAGRELIIGFNDLETRFPDLAKEFHPTLNGNVTAKDIHGGQPKDYWWLGACGHEWEARLTNRTAKDSGCPECALTGYKSTKPGLLYFIENDAFGAFKIGITNPSAKNNRLKGFQKDGWKIITTLHDEDGRLILRLETSLLNWIRKDLKLGQYLSKDSVGSMNGSSETFDSGLVSAGEILKEISRRYESLKNALD